MVSTDESNNEPASAAAVAIDWSLDANYLFINGRGSTTKSKPGNANSTIGVALIGWNFMAQGIAQLETDLAEITTCDPWWECAFGPPSGSESLILQTLEMKDWSLDVGVGGGDPKLVLANAFTAAGYSDADLYFDFGDPQHELYFDTLGNITWGAAMNHIGMPRSIAQPAQQQFGISDAGDILSVDIGYDLYDAFGTDLTFGDMVIYLNQNMALYEAIMLRNPQSAEHKLRPR